MFDQQLKQECSNYWHNKLNNFLKMNGKGAAKLQIMHHPLIFITNRSQFERIETTKSNKKKQQKQQKTNKELVIVPLTKIKPSLAQRPNRQLPLQYIHPSISFLQYPLRSTYELTDPEETFYKQKLQHHGISKKIFIDLLISSEQKSLKNQLDFPYKEMYLQVLKRNGMKIKKSQKNEMKEVFKDVFAFWRRKRVLNSNGHYPFYRPFWISDSNFGHIFRKRDDHQIVLRNRGVRIQMDEVNEILIGDLLKLQKILALMKEREELKIQLIEKELEESEESEQKSSQVQLEEDNEKVDEGESQGESQSGESQSMTPKKLQKSFQPSRSSQKPQKNNQNDDKIDTLNSGKFVTPVEDQINISIEILENSLDKNDEGDFFLMKMEKEEKNCQPIHEYECDKPQPDYPYPYSYSSQYNELERAHSLIKIESISSNILSLNDSSLEILEDKCTKRNPLQTHTEKKDVDVRNVGDNESFLFFLKGKNHSVQ